jgi:hypothetical protein
MIRKLAIAAAAACLLVSGVGAQDKKEKPWTDWSKKEVEKILNDSPWGQTQTMTDTSEMFYSPTTTPTNGGPSRISSSSRDTEGATNQATNVKYRIRFFSARPIRQALVRSMMLGMKGTPDAATAERLKNFAELQSNENIIIAVAFEANDQRSGNSVMQSFNSSTTGTLKNSTYLERSDGKRVFLEEYAIPGRDGFGARFIFPREVDGQPVISPESGDVRFVSEVARNIRLDMKFKVSDLFYGGKLEY